MGDALNMESTENVIIQKLLRYRKTACDEHLKDVLRILDSSSKRLNYDLIHKETRTRGVEEEWELVKAVYFLRLISL